MTLAHYEITLPLPPSVNGLWRSGRNGVYKSARYETWRAHAAKAIYDQLPGATVISGRYCLSMSVPIQAKADLDNLLKATNDILQHCEIVTDDKNTWAITVDRSSNVRAEFCRVSVTELEIEKGN